MPQLYSLSKPKSIAVCLESIPDELKAINRWVVWRWMLRDKKWSKPPFNSSTRKFASPTDSSTWSSYSEAVDCLELWEGCTDEFDGLGFVIGEPYVGIDLDDCRCPETGEIEVWANDIADRVATYAEISPSGKGLEMWLKGELLGAGIRRPIHSGAIEIYSECRYFTITGMALNSYGIEDRQVEINDLYAEFARVEQADKHTVEKEKARDGFGDHLGRLELTSADREVISIAQFASNGEYFKRLYAGSNCSHKSSSEADLAFCSILAFYTCSNADAIDRIFRSSGRMRDKWSREDYREDTIFRAIESTSRYYHKDFYND